METSTTQQKTKRFRRFLLIVAVNLAITFLFILAVELISSLFVYLPGSNVVEHPRLNHTWRPNSSNIHKEWIYKNPEFPQPYIHYYNRQGWLEKYDVQKEKLELTYRIFYLGDSFTEGTCPMDQSVPSIVERRLSDLGKNGNLKFEVINTGTSSYSPTLFYLLVRYVLMGYSPDLIVVNIDMTDDFDDWKYSRTLIRDNEGNPLFAPPREIYKSLYIDTERGAKKAMLWSRIQLFLIQHSYTYNLILKNKKKVYGTSNDNNELNFVGIAQQSYSRWAWCQSTWNESTIRNVRNTLDLLRRLAIWCQQNDIKIMFTGVPHYWQYSGNFDGSGEPRWSNRSHHELAHLAKELGVPYLNSYEQLKPIILGTPQTKFYYYRDMHLNPRGYSVWAEAHVQFLTSRANKLLPEEFLSR